MDTVGRIPGNHIAHSRARAAHQVTRRPDINAVLSVGEGGRAIGAQANKIPLNYICPAGLEQNAAGSKGVDHQTTDHAAAPQNLQPGSRRAGAAAVELNQRPTGIAGLRGCVDNHLVCDSGEGGQWRNGVPTGARQVKEDLTKPDVCIYAYDRLT